MTFSLVYVYVVVRHIASRLNKKIKYGQLYGAYFVFMKKKKKNLRQKSIATEIRNVFENEWLEIRASVGNIIFRIY